jgi:hypothetical protein
MIGRKLHDYIQNELNSDFPFLSDQQLVAMVCDPVMLTLAVLWLCGARYKDDLDNAKELFKSAFVDEAMRSFRPLEPDAMLNASPDHDKEVDVQVCDDDDVFGMVNFSSPSQDIKSGASTAFDTATSGDLANEAFKEWISLKVDWSTWLLNE